MDAVETRYVRSETGWIAYQVVGSGPVDVVVVRPALFPIDLMWDEPALAGFLDGLSSFSRHVWFDPRGTGASDPIDQAEGRLVESWVDDVVAVIDAVGCERVVVLGLCGASGRVVRGDASGADRIPGAREPQRPGEHSGWVSGGCSRRCPSTSG